jgi:hypothetical protein
MGVALEWEPWNWDLWDTSLGPDDDDASLDVYRQKLDEALQAGRGGDENLAGKLRQHNS